jgi:hypothetical protein
MPIQFSEIAISGAGTSEAIRLSKDIDSYEVSMCLHIAAGNTPNVTLEASMDKTQCQEFWGISGQPPGKWFPVPDSDGVTATVQRKLDGELYTALRVRYNSGAGAASLLVNQLRKGA